MRLITPEDVEIWQIDERLKVYEQGKKLITLRDGWDEAKETDYKKLIEAEENVKRSVLRIKRFHRFWVPLFFLLGALNFVSGFASMQQERYFITFLDDAIGIWLWYGIWKTVRNWRVVP